MKNPLHLGFINGMTVNFALHQNKCGKLNLQMYEQSLG
jgi:hypothetical protein